MLPSVPGAPAFRVQDEGVLLPARQRLNFIGSGVSAVDNPSSGRTDVTVSGGGTTNVTFAANSGLPVFNVKSATYGAVGDGTTNDYVAIKAAIEACYGAGGGIVYFPPGSYKYDGNMSPPYNEPGLPARAGVNYLGAGIDRTILKPDVKDGGMAFGLKLGSPYSWVQDMTIQSNALAASRNPFGWSAGIEPTGVKIGWYMNVLTRVKLSGFWYGARATAGGGPPDIESAVFLIERFYDCEFEGNKYDVYAVGGTNAGVNQNVFYGCKHTVAGGDYGLYLLNGASNIVYGADMESSGSSGNRAKFITFGASQDANFPNVIRDSYFEGYGRIDLTGTSNAHPMTVIEGSGFAGSATPIYPTSGGPPLLMRACQSPNVQNPSGAQAVRITNCKDVTVSNSGSNLTQTDNF